MYEFTDKAIAVMNRAVQHEFATLRRSLLSFDNVNAILAAVNACYGAIDRVAKECYLSIAKDAYKTVTGRDSMITYFWLEQFLYGYDSVTKYVYAHEFDRKRARLFEAVVASKKKDFSKELKQAMLSLATQLKQEADEVTDAATLKGYQDSGVTRVRWITESDGRVCMECRKRHWKTYLVSAVPDKPHIRCRCYLIPATEHDKQPTDS